MEVILKEDIKSLGRAGDVVIVKEGFARNFLLPHGKAIEADTQNLKSLEHHKKSVAARQSKLTKEAGLLAEKLLTLSVTIQKESGEDDKLFGSVTTSDIADALRKENLSIDKKKIVLQHPIKQLGLHEVAVKLHSGVTAALKVSVVKK